MAARHRQAKKSALARDDAPSACEECGKRPGLVTGELIYPHRPEYKDRPFWRCLCGAYVGCHPGTYKALGTPCGYATRQARIAAHEALDGLWRRKMAKDGVGKHEARPAAYRWMAAQLNIDPARCHIGMMNEATARRVVEICAPFVKAQP